MMRHSRKQRRPAAAVMIALVVVLVVGLIMSLSLRAILKSSRQTRQEQQRLKAISHPRELRRSRRIELIPIGKIILPRDIHLVSHAAPSRNKAQPKPRKV